MAQNSVQITGIAFSETKVENRVKFQLTNFLLSQKGFRLGK